MVQLQVFLTEADILVLGSNKAGGVREHSSSREKQGTQFL